jgi:hypothetical protein
MDANSTIWTPKAQYGRQQHNMYANSTIWTLTAQYGRQQHNVDDYSTIWTPTTHEFSRKFAKKSSERRKIREERRKKEKKFPIFGPLDLSNSDSYRTIGSPM